MGREERRRKEKARRRGGVVVVSRGRCSIAWSDFYTANKRVLVPAGNSSGSKVARQRVGGQREKCRESMLLRFPYRRPVTYVHTHTHTHVHAPDRTTVDHRQPVVRKVVENFEAKLTFVITFSTDEYLSVSLSLFVRGIFRSTDIFFIDRFETQFLFRYTLFSRGDINARRTILRKLFLFF